MREYELTVLLHPDLEMNLEAPLEKVRGIITDNGGEITKEDNWGKRRLAYRIAKEDFAVYVYFEVKAPAEAVRKIDGILNITDEVVRHLLVAVDQKARAAASQAKKSDSEEEVKEGSDE